MPKSRPRRKRWSATSRARRRAARPAARGRPLVFRARGRRDHPRRICAAPAFPRREADLELERLIAVYLRRIQGDHGGWPLFHEGAFDISASVKAYFALKMIGDDPDAPHMRARARSDPRPRRRGEEQRLHPLPARALWRHSLARRSGHAGRDHAAAALVSLPSRQGLLLGAHGARAAHGAAGRLSRGPPIRAASGSRNCSLPPPETVRDWPTGAHQAWLA